MTAAPPPSPRAPRPASPDARPRCSCCRGKRSLAVPGDPRIFVCPLCDYADNKAAGGCFGPVHPG